MYDALTDLLLGSSCAVCGVGGRPLCPACRVALPPGAAVRRPTPCPEGLALPMAAGDYGDALKSMILAHKEHRVLALARPLGDLLAQVVGELPGVDGEPLVLVPVPSRPAVVRARGHDPMLRIARVAAGRLRTDGLAVGVRRLLRAHRVVRDQAGLDADGRAANLQGAFVARGRSGTGAPPVVVVDDVLTTGATVREAQRALEDAGHRVLGIAAVAATRRRRQGQQG